MYNYRLDITQSGLIFRRNHIFVTEGRYGQEKRVRVLASEDIYGKYSKALDRVKQVIRQDRFLQGNWRVSEGGQYAVSNGVTITPDLDIGTAR